MEFEKTSDEMDLGYPNVPAGRYLWEIEEVDLFTNDETGSRSYIFRLVCDQPIDGDKDAAGLKDSWVINVIKKDGNANEFGEKQVNGVVSMTGGTAYFAKKFTDGVDIDDDKLSAALALKLPGKFLDMTHVMEKYNDKEGNEKERSNFIKFQAAKKSGGAKKEKKASVEEESW